MVKKKRKRKKDFADVTDLNRTETGKLTVIIWVGPECNHMYPYKRKAKGDFIHRG